MGDTACASWLYKRHEGEHRPVIGGLFTAVKRADLSTVRSPRRRMIYGGRRRSGMLTEADLPSHSFIPLRWMLALGGVARTHDFREHHCTDEDIRLATRYGSIQRIRIGWYAIPALDRAVVDAVRCGGRLACLSRPTRPPAASARSALPCLPARPLSLRGAGDMGVRARWRGRDGRSDRPADRGAWRRGRSLG